MEIHLEIEMIWLHTQVGTDNFTIQLKRCPTQPSFTMVHVYSNVYFQYKINAEYANNVGSSISGVLNIQPVCNSAALGNKCSEQIPSSMQLLSRGTFDGI